MECPFQVGDEVERVKPDAPRAFTRTGVIYPVTGVVVTETGRVGILLGGVDNGGPTGPHSHWGHAPANFRKVERKTDKRSLTEWLSQPSGDTDHIDKSKKRERV